ncbi:hypothetical protein ACSBR2_040616 [Camellia fascicularis]
MRENFLGLTICAVCENRLRESSARVQQREYQTCYCIKLKNWSGLRCLVIVGQGGLLPVGKKPFALKRESISLALHFFEFYFSSM